MPVPHADFREVWWIYSPVNNREWAGLRLAVFKKTTNGALICTIHGEIDRNRWGIRIWEDIQQTELWIKVKQIPIPTEIEIHAAVLNHADEMASVPEAGE